MNSPKVSIIFTNFSGGKNPLECLLSIEKLNYPKNFLETIVVDNHSTDGSTQEIQKKFPWAKVICLKRNLGFAGAVNVGIKNAKGEYLFITNDDIVFEKNSLKTLVDYAEKHPNVGVVGGKQLNLKNKKFLAGGRNFNFFTGRQQMIKPQKPSICDQIDGCTMLIPKKIFTKVGFFDTGFFPLYGEDLDFCLRVKKNGFRVVYHPRAIFFHKYSQAASKLKLEDLFFYGFKNKLRIILKHANLFQILTFFLFNYFINVPVKIIIYREPILIPQLKALIWNLKNIKQPLNARNKK